MRKSSKILAIVFLLTAGGLVFWSTQRDEAEIEAAVLARVEGATAERQQEIEEELAEARRAMEDAFAQRRQALTDSLAAREAALDSARTALEHPVFFRLTAADVEQVLRRMGVDYERGTDDDNDPKFTFRLATYTATLYFYGCNDADACTSLRIYGGFKLNEPPGQDVINEWNRTKRYATAYLSESGAARIDNDLIVEGGITLGAVEKFILNFRDRLEEFADHIDF